VVNAVCGRCRYSDLKEAALSGADDLWVLNAVELLLVGCMAWVRIRRERLSREFVEANILRSVA
jgi:hypothetical protein